MRRPIDFTIVVALDARTVGQFARTWPTWRTNKPDLLNFNWIVIVDAAAGSPRQWRDRLESLELPPHQLISWGWPQSDDADGDSPITQRERMLTAFVRVPPACCQTSHWVKIDTDVVALRPGPWLHREWLDLSATPCIVASPWGYTKPPDALHRLQAWADAHPDSILRQTKPLDLPELTPDLETMPYPRVASWICVVELGFSKLASQLCDGRLPIPSQDTYHWYLAERLKIPVKRHNFKKGGWATIHSDKRRKEIIKEIMDKKT